MEFRIADTFTDSLDKAKDSSFRSVRVSSDIRLIGENSVNES